MEKVLNGKEMMKILEYDCTHPKDMKFQPGND